MRTIKELQEPQSLRLAIGALNANELRIAQALSAAFAIIPILVAIMAWCIAHWAF